MPELEPALGGGSYFFYPKPNPALTEILVSEELQGVTADWTAKVGFAYVAKIQARTRTNDRHPSHLESTVDANVFIGGYEDDRWVGEISVGADYALADEFGRHTPAPGQHGSTYEGHGDLRSALYENLPPI
jgi:hypothetical protein